MLKGQTGIVLALTLLLCVLSIFFWDQPLSLKMSDPSLYLFRRICREITDIGLSQIYFITSAIGYILARWVFPKLGWFSNRLRDVARMRLASAFSFMCFLSIGALVHILKFAFGRQRPHLSETFESTFFEPFNFHWHWHSFPSGHSQVIFTAATLVALLYPKQKYLFLLLAVGVAFTRVVTHQHFLSDTIFGSAIGYLGTLWIFEIFYRKKFEQLTPNTRS